MQSELEISTGHTFQTLSGLNLDICGWRVLSCRVQLVTMMLQYIPRFYVIKEHIKSLFLGLEVGTFYICVESLLQSIIIEIM